MAEWDEKECHCPCCDEPKLLLCKRTTPSNELFADVYMGCVDCGIRIFAESIDIGKGKYRVLNSYYDAELLDECFSDITWREITNFKKVQTGEMINENAMSRDDIIEVIKAY